MRKPVPIVILSGFLGNGKTTLLGRILKTYEERGLRLAVIQNEVGDVGIDSLLTDSAIPTRELLSGCICCTIRSDLGLAIRELTDTASPDLILIEATGAANPLEVLDGAAEAALLAPVQIRAVIGVADAAHFLHWRRIGTGRTYRLMSEQLRCASAIVLNKADLVGQEELDELDRAIRELNPNAAVRQTVQCDLDVEALLETQGTIAPVIREAAPACECSASESEEPRRFKIGDEGKRHTHGSHHHVVAYTHEFARPVEQARLESMLRGLPYNVYRAKGIFTAAETGERMLFQYAYKHSDVMRIRPQGGVRDVAVFIGEALSSNELGELLGARGL